ncbi:hypothetical protein [Tardiphaga sp. 367_B4_N1_1]|uniref:hypothetical protein n=1 Tax=Tardiphaga sp. 367_B4_N1_1 TaxID=3240777 RepID=UPI003F2010E3
MAKTSQAYADRAEEDRPFEGPDQELDIADVVAVAVPFLLEYICYSLAFACCLVWLAIGSTGGRI